MYARYESEELEFLLGADFEASLSEVADGSFFSALNHETNIYFLRHGQSEGNARMTYQGVSIIPLTKPALRRRRMQDSGFQTRLLMFWFRAPRNAHR